MQFEVKNRFTGSVQFTAEIECAEGAERSIKLGLAVKWALKSRADLSRADLSRADLSRADLSRADLSRADLSGANLSGANLSGADLSRAYLSGANLSGADLSRAYLSGANLSGANLSGAYLSGADLGRADLSGAEEMPDWIMPDGIPWSQYLKDVVPALLNAGGRSVAEIVALGAWDCHSWDNCPMAAAFGVHKVADVPPLYRARAIEFVQFFDARLIPKPDVPEDAPAPAAA